MPEDTIRMWLVQLVDALAYAHSQSYVHKNIKVRNSVSIFGFFLKV